MKKMFWFFLLIFNVQLSAQTYPITSINISIPVNPDANTSKWATVSSLIMITANARMVNGKVDDRVRDSKILLIIKKSGTKFCGSNTANTAPSANFNTNTKVWSGTNAISLIGQECTLPPGDYDFCVQFFGDGPTGIMTLSEEKCKPFTIRGKEQISYQPPQNISPINANVFTETDINKPVSFRWTPVVPKPTEPVTYRLKVWQLMQGQNRTQAMKANQPIITKDVDNITQAVITNLIIGPCKPPYLCDFVWNVQAFNKEGKGIGNNNGMSEIWAFSLEERINIQRNNISCKDLKIKVEKKYTTGTKDDCCFDLSIKNKIAINSIVGLRIYTNNSMILPATINNVWTQVYSNNNISKTTITFKRVEGYIPKGETFINTICFTNIQSDPFYLKYEWLDKGGKEICKDSIQMSGCGGGDGCKNSLIRNSGFNLSSVAGIMPTPGTTQFWTSGYGSPTVINNPNDPNEGFIEMGYIKLSGNVSNGQSVMQSLDPNNKIIAGKKYKLSVAVRFLNSQNSIDYGKIRATAFNGSIYSSTGVHPNASTDVAIIGRSSKIKDCNDWSVIEFPVWTANKDFLNIAINAFTNDGQNATLLIDNVTICESVQENCNEVQVDENGNPIMPAGFGDVTSGFNCQAVAEEDNYYNGSLQDLYPGYNGTTDLYTQNSNSCYSIGGTLPQDINNYSCDDSLKAAGINMTCEELQALLNQEFVPTEIKKNIMPPIAPVANKICDRPMPKNMESMPFKGRDIIYIHGLQMDHIVDRANGEHGATGRWPNNQSEYFSGYYKNVATNNMLPHIFHFLRNRGNLNRFIIVAYDCSETAEVAVNAVLTQIREAMENGTGVQSDPSDPRGKNCFGRDFVMISHSTGAIIADVALSIANKTKTNINLKMQYGDIGLISDRCKGRVSIQGAYSGSNLAKLACIGAQSFPELFGLAVAAIAFHPISTQTINTIASTPNIIANSILVDLVPEITRSRWGSYINDISVPVLTLAGGHPSAILGPLKYNILPGFDDGVLTMDCANGNNNPLSFGPSSFNTTPSKLFDMGIPLIRAINYYKDQKISDGVFAAASTAYLSPTGMVVPVNSINMNPQNHFNNHYSFVQASKEHWFATTEPGSGNTPCDYKQTLFGGSTNNEEVLVVSNSSLYTPGLINPAIISQMGETIKDLHIDYPWLKIVYRRGIPRLSVIWKKFYIWKRTYHKLNDNCMYDVDYAYKYLFN